MSEPLKLHLGVKTDPIEYRYSFEWLFSLLAEEGIRFVQLGSFFEVYRLPDSFFRELRTQAESFGIRIASLFTAHRELGGFFREEPGFVEVARSCYERFIEIGGLLGADSVGSNPGAVLRDRMAAKKKGSEIYLRHMKELMRFAKHRGISVLGIEPMSCLAEPPTLPDEMKAMAGELLEYHRKNLRETSSVGFCTDVAHGYADETGRIVFSHMDLLEAALPYTTEIHLKNTDSRFDSTFGFTEKERKKGIVDIPAVRNLLMEHAAELPVGELVGYLEIGGPKLGRDYSDPLLEENLRESIRYLKSAFVEGEPSAAKKTFSVEPNPVPKQAGNDEKRRILVVPSLMCADLCRLEESVNELRETGIEILHIDIMDSAFVPNMPLGLETLRQLKTRTPLLYDVHLMVEDNDFFIERFAEIGATMLSVHVEAVTHLDRTLARIKEHGIRAGVALNPATPLREIEWVLDKLDFVLLMMVNPGFAGQNLVESMLDKIRNCRRLLDDRGKKIPIEVDGNVSFGNIPGMVAAGADILVAGTSSLFHPAGSIGTNYRKLAEAIERGLPPESVTNP